MIRTLMLGAAVVAFALIANVNIASADHCYSGGYGRFGGGYYGGHTHSHRHRGYGYSTYRYSAPYYGSYYGRRRVGYAYYPRYGRSFYGGSGIYIRGRNFSFGYGY